ncbi:MAG: hypothetical protein R3E89_04985 [Thiolinea sp.]
MPGQKLISTLLIAPILVPEVVLAVALLLFEGAVHAEKFCVAADGACNFYPAACGSWWCRHG